VLRPHRPHQHTKHLLECVHESSIVSPHQRADAP
jgi:hypothetical protein